MVTRLGLVIVGSAAACGLANAQGLSPFYIRGGATWPYSSSTRGDSSNYGLFAGVGYILEGPGLSAVGGRQGSVQIDFGHFGGNTNIETYDLEYVERFTAVGKFYVGVGGGLRVAHYGAPTAAAPAGGGGSGGVFRGNDLALFGNTDNNQATYVGEALVGVGLTKNIGVEVSAKFAPSYHTESTSSVSLLLSYRF